MTDLLRIEVSYQVGNPLIRVHVTNYQSVVLLHVDAPAKIALNTLAQFIETEAASVPTRR